MIRVASCLLLGLALGAAEGPSLLSLAPEAQAAAVHSLMAATPVHLPGGRTTLATAVAALSAGGNRVALADGLAPATEADLPPVDGTWWEAVRTVCAGFGLRFDQGIPGEEDIGGEGHRVPVGHGCLVLSSDAAGSPAFICDGAVAVVAEPSAVRTAAEGTRLTLRLWARAEPRLPRGRLAWARAEDPVIERGGQRTSLEAVGDGDGETPHQPAALLAAKLDGGGSALGTLTTTLRLAPVERWQATAVLKPGVVQKVEQGGRQIEVTLHLGPGAVEWMGSPLPDRRPMLLLTGPGDLLDSMQVGLTAGGADVGLRGSSSRSGGDAQRAVMRFLRAAPDGDVTANLAGRVAVAPLPLAVRLPLSPLVPAAAATDPDAPSHVAWAAGSAPLSRWVAALAATGNPVLLEVGINADTAVTVPAVSGTFWEATIALCRAADLQPACGDAAAIAGGPLRLSRRNGKPLSASACGPILALATASPATITAGGRQEHQLRLDLAMATEPRLNAERFSQPAATWASFAADQDGAPRSVITGVATGENQPGLPPGFGFQRGVIIQRRMAVQIDGGEGATAPIGATVRLAGGEHEVTVSGMLMLPRVRTLHATAEVAVGVPTEVVIGSQVVELLARNGKAEGASPLPPGMPAEANGIVLRGLAGVEAVQLNAVLADGTPIEGNADANQLGDANLGTQWFSWSHVPPEGKLTVAITARSPQQPLALPVRITVPVP